MKGEQQKLPVEGGSYKCILKACHHCFRHLSDRSYLSLDAVVNGHVPATAAVGYGLPPRAGRWAPKANVSRNRKLRRVPSVRLGWPEVGILAVRFRSHSPHPGHRLQHYDLLGHTQFDLLVGL